MADGPLDTLFGGIAFSGESSDVPARDEVPAPAPWSAVANDFQTAYPDLDQADLQKRWETARELRIARERHRDWSPPAVHTAIQAMPLASNYHNTRIEVQYQRAAARIAEHRAESGDYDIVAQVERSRELEGQRGVAEEVGHFGLRVAAMAGEAGLAGRAIGAAAEAPGVIGRGARAIGLGGELGDLAGASGRGAASPLVMAGEAGRAGVRVGATTAMMPGMWAPEWTQNNVQAGRDPMDIEGLPSAFALGMVNVAILGSLGGQTSGLARGTGMRAMATRIGAAGPIGFAEQQAADVASTLVGLRSRETGYGSIGQLVRDWDKPGGRENAFQQAAITALTFSAFGALHEGQNGRAHADAFLDYTRQQSENGLPRSVTAEAIQAVQKTMADALAKNPNMTRSQAREVMKQYSENPAVDPLLRRFAATQADALPETATRVDSPMTPDQANTGLANEQARMQQEGRNSQGNRSPAETAPNAGTGANQGVPGQTAKPPMTARERSDAAENQSRLIYRQLDEAKANLRRLSREFVNPNPKEIAEAKAKVRELDKAYKQALPEVDRLRTEAAAEGAAAQGSGQSSQSSYPRMDASRSAELTASRERVDAAQKEHSAAQSEGGDTQIAKDRRQRAATELTAAMESHQTLAERLHRSRRSSQAPENLLFHTLSYKSPKESVRDAQRVLEGGTMRPIDTWADTAGSKLGPAHERSNANAEKGTATLVFDRNAIEKSGGTIQEREGIAKVYNKNAPKMDPALKQVRYKGEGSAPDFAKLKETVDALNTKRAEFGLPPVELVATMGQRSAERRQQTVEVPVERRQGERRRVADMTHEEARKELLTSQTVDLPNKRAFDEAPKSPVVGFSDADGLKAFNDRFGYAAGDALLNAKAEALKAAGVDAYHEKGDEFLHRGGDPQVLRQQLETARQILRETIIVVEEKDGSVSHLIGADFSFGVGTDVRQAEAGLKAHKSEREARGERARGELRGITKVGPEEGQANIGGTDLQRPSEAAGPSAVQGEAAPNAGQGAGPVAPDQGSPPASAGQAPTGQPEVNRPGNEANVGANAPASASSNATGRRILTEKVSLHDAQAFARLIHEAGQNIIDHFGNEPFTGPTVHKVFISDLYDAVKDRLQGDVTLTEFKKQVGKMIQSGHLEGSRQDLAAGAKQSPGEKGWSWETIREKMADSHTPHPMSDDAVFHHVVIPKQTSNAASGRVLGEQFIANKYGKELDLALDRIFEERAKRPQSQESEQQTLVEIMKVFKDAGHSPQEAIEYLARVTPEEIANAEAEALAAARSSGLAPAKVREDVAGVKSEVEREAHSEVAAPEVGRDAEAPQGAEAAPSAESRTAGNAPAAAPPRTGEPAGRDAANGRQPDTSGGERSGVMSAEDWKKAETFNIQWIFDSSPKSQLENIAKEAEQNGRADLAKYIREEMMPKSPAESGFGRPVTAAERRILPSGGQPDASGAGRPGRLTALAYEHVDAERVKMGKEPILAQEARSDPEVWQKAMDALEKDPTAASRLVEELNKNPRPATAEENALLDYHMTALRNEHERAMLDFVRSFAQKADEATINGHDVRERELSELLDKADKAASLSGSEAGRSFRLRRLLIAEDFSLRGLLKSKEAALGRPLTEAEKVEIAELSAKIKELQDKLDAAEKAGTVKPGEPSDIDFELTRIKTKIKTQLQKDREARAPWPVKALRMAGEAVSIPKSLMASIDFPLLRQGMVGMLSHPVRTSKAIPEMFRSFFSEDVAQRALYEIRHDPMFKVAEPAGLEITSSTEGKSSGREEGFLSNVIGKVPVVGHITRASERAYQTILNRIRFDTFKGMAESLSTNGKLTPAEASIIANWANVSTGRGPLGKMEPAATLLNHTFFAPKWAISRFQLLLGQPLWTQIGTSAPRARLEVAKEYARLAVGLGVVVGLASAAGFTFEKDPRATDFLKLKMGNTRLDFTGGLANTGTFLSRVFSQSTKTNTGVVRSLRAPVAFGRDDTASVVGRFARGKLAPIPGAALDQLTGQNVVGQRVTPAQTAMQVTTPLFARDVYEAMVDLGMPKGTAVSLLGLLGMSIQVHEPRRARPR
jgi:GGDEF domain-containing protein